MEQDKSLKEVDLSKVKLKLLTDYFDLADAESLLSRFHPKGARKAQGRRLSYIAEYRGEWIAVMLFDSAVKNNRLRESKIGWDKSQKESRVVHVANNSRFLLSPKYTGTKNLASKILSMVAERISGEWQRRYGVPLLALETYVDPEHNDNTGACYVAAGWENLGLSSGYQAYGAERTHGKWYFLKELNSNGFKALRSEIPHALLTGVKEVSGKSNNNYVLDASKFDIKALQKDLSLIRDPRNIKKIRYPFIPFLSLCIAAVVSGYTQYRQIADWIKKLPAEERARFGFPGNSAPQESTVSKFLRRIEPDELQQVLKNWLLKTYNKKVDFSTITLDGKAIRGTSWSADKQASFLNVFVSELGIVIEHKPTKKGGGEKITAREVLKSDINLENKIVLADAIHTDRAMLEGLKKKVPRTSSLLKEINRL